MFKKVLLISLAVIVLIAACLTVYVSNMDWNTYKNDIAARFSNTLGKKIEFSGNLNVSLWPKPHLSVKNVNILNTATSEKIASVKNLEAQLSLRALLEGTPEIESLSLNGTEIWYVVDENGVSNWRQQQKGMFLDSNIEFNRQTISIQNSWVHYQNRKYELNIDFSQVNADIVAESLVGPYRIDGNFMYAEDNFGFAVGMGDISQTDDIFLNFAVTHPSSNSYILYDGSYNMTSGAFKGNFSGEFQLLATLVNSLSQKETLAEMFNVPFVFSVVLDANSQMVTMNSLALKYANAIEGSGNIKLPLTVSEGKKPIVDIQYQFLNLDGRPLLMVAEMALNALKAGELQYKPQTEFDVNYDVSVQHMAISDAADGALENMSIKGTWKDNELDIDEFYAACPGNIVWTMSGSLLAEENVPSLFLKNRIQGKNVGALIRAFGFALNAPSQAAYRNIDINFNLSAEPQTLIFSDLEAMMDKGRLSGTFSADFSQPRTKYELSGEIDSINFDNYVEPAEASEKLTNTLKHYLNMLHGLQAADWIIDVTADQAIFKSIPLKDLAVALKTDENKIVVKNLSLADVLGAKIILNGEIYGLETGEPVFSGLEYNMSTGNVSPLIAKLNLLLPQWNIFKDKPMQASGLLSGNLQEAEIDTSTTLKNTILTYKGKVAQKEQFEFDGNGNLKSTGFSELVNDLGGKWGKLKNNSAINCGGHIKGNAKNWEFDNAECVLGTAKYSGKLHLQQEKNMSYIDGKIAASEFDLANVLDVQRSKTGAENNLLYADDFIARPIFSRDVYDFDSYRNLDVDVEFSAAQVLFNNKALQNVATSIKNEQGLLGLNDLTFGYQNAQYVGQIQVDYTQEPKIKSKLKAENFALNDVGGKIYKLNSGMAQLAIDVQSSAVSEEKMMQNMMGTIDFKIDNLRVDGLNFGAIAEDLQTRVYSKGLFQNVRDNLQQGHTDFRECAGQIKIQQGTWNFENTVCKNDDVSLTLQGKDDVGEWQMNNNLSAKFAALPNVAPIDLTFSGMINKPTLEVNVEKVVKQYDEHWAQIEKQRQEEQDKKQRVINANMEQAQKKVEDLARQIDDISALLESYVAATKEENYVGWYNKKIEYLKYLSKKTDEMSSVERQAQWTDDDVKQIEDKCTEFNLELSKLSDDIKKEHQADLEAQIKTLQENVRQIKADNSKAYNDYQLQLQDKFSQLIRYDASQNPAEDENILKIQEEIAEQRDLFWNESYKISDAFMQIYNISGTENLRNALDNLQQQANKLKDLSAQTSERYSAAFLILDKQIEQKKAIYDAERERLREEKQQEREENKDNLLANDDGKNEDVSVQQKENEKSETAPKASQSTLREIDESVVLGEVSGKIAKSYDEKKPTAIEPKATGLLRATDGDIGEASGSISVK
ncbi:MAG: AsmA family protein [Alphaproteobacteria bacterium]|nr:AsmA family protein [Alphaproteobacteria bacterium]